ncbi:MAG: tetraacyldisaccharide 4'-kinase [Sandarakinorhabdus sp.]|nr:tetraacyldisaccharide 4'-kinase [Sandarakinorhabdus sp.]
MNAPGFWWRARAGWQSWLLAPLGALYAAITARRMARPGWRASVPVICCGNPTVGGSGKTILALDIGARLLVRGRKPAFLTRGYGGTQRLPIRVAGQSVAEIGDEALLLAACAPTYVGADRAATARLAIADGADVLVLDDGLQNPTLAKDFSFLVVDGAAGFGNACPIPAGPLRETLPAAIARSDLAVVIGDDATGAATQLGGLQVLAARLLADTDLTGRKVYAFAGIGRPAKFGETLAAAGANVVQVHAFPDHHPYSDADLHLVLNAAAALCATPVTTPKDATRLGENLRDRFEVVGVTLAWTDPAAIEAALSRALRRGA